MTTSCYLSTWSRATDMKQHSPGCTCCKPSLFTNDLSYARILENSPTFISDGPFAAPRGLSFGVDSHGDHDTYDFPWWAKIWGGNLKHMGRDGGFSAILGDLFGWGDFVQGGWNSNCKATCRPAPWATHSADSAAYRRSFPKVCIRGFFLGDVLVESFATKRLVIF